MSLDSLLADDTIVVRRQTVSKDSSGGSTRTRSDREAAIPARVESIGGTQRLQYAQLAIPVTHRVFTRYRGVVNGDIIVTSDNLVIRVTAVNENRGIGGIDTYFEYLGEEIKV